VIITCVRDDALITLKIKDVDARKKIVWQNPKHVRTKRHKSIVTGFVSTVMPLAEDIVLEWLAYTVDILQLKPNDPLFPKTLVTTNLKTMAFEVQGLSTEHWANAQPVRNICKNAFQDIDIKYFNPHLFRDTVCKWALNNCSQYEYKALSQNFGHDHAMTTYNAYGNLTEDEQLEAISNIGKTNPDLQNASTEDLLAEFSRRAGK
jgi:integrase